MAENFFLFFNASLFFLLMFHSIFFVGRKMFRIMFEDIETYDARLKFFIVQNDFGIRR